MAEQKRPEQAACWAQILHRLRSRVWVCRYEAALQRTLQLLCSVALNTLSLKGALREDDTVNATLTATGGQPVFSTLSRKVDIRSCPHSSAGSAGVGCSSLESLLCETGASRLVASIFRDMSKRRKTD